MRSTRYIFSAAIAAVVSLGLTDRVRGAAFLSSNNLVVIRCTNGGLGGAERIYLDEYDVTGPSPALVQTIEMPWTGPDAVTEPNLTNHDRHLHRSTDGRFLSFTGYNMPYAAGGVTDPSAERSADTPRMVGLVKYDGSFDLSTKLTDAFDGTGIRGAVTTDGSKIWVAGDNLSGATNTGGIRFTTKGSSTTVNLSQVQTMGGPKTTDNIREVNIFAGQLYDSSGSNASVGKAMLKVGTGVPESGSQPHTLMTTDGVSVSSFSLLDANPAVPGVDTAYTASSGSLRKYNLVGSNWTPAGLLSDGFDFEDITTKLDPSTGQSTIFARSLAGNIYRLFDPTPYGAPLSGSLGSPYITAAAGFDLGGFDFAPAAPVSTWNVDADGAWPTAPNWLGPVPNALDWTANFGSIINSPHTVSLTAAQTVGTVTFNNTNKYTLTGVGTLNFDVTSGNAAILVTLGTHEIQSPVNAVKDLEISVAPANSTLKLANLLTTPNAVTKSGNGKLELNRARAGTLNVNAGVVAILANGTDASAGKLGALAIAGGTTPTATLDLNDNDLIVGNSTPSSTIVAQIKNARNGGAWNQPGITSSAAGDNPGHNTTLGILSGTEYSSVGGTGTFAGQSYIATDTLVKYTWYGDTDFNGVVGFDDYTRIDQGFNLGRTGWLNGDFDYSGVVGFDDYSLIDLSFNTQSGTLNRAISFLSGQDASSAGMDAPSLQMIEEHLDQFGPGYAQAFLAAVPEPAGASVILSVGAAFAARRRRRMSTV